jgi:hypothetical protein
MYVYVDVCMHVFLSMCVYVCMYVFMYILVCDFLCIYVCCMCVCVCVCMYVCMYMCVYMFVCGCVCVGLYECMYVCMYVYIYIYIYILYVCVCLPVREHGKRIEVRLQAPIYWSRVDHYWKINARKQTSYNGKYCFLDRSSTEWNKLPEGVIGTSHGKTHILKTRVRKVKTSEGKWREVVYSYE